MHTIPSLTNFNNYSVAPPKLTTYLAYIKHRVTGWCRLFQLLLYELVDVLEVICIILQSTLC